MLIRWLPLCIALVPLIGVHAAYLIAAPSLADADPLIYVTNQETNQVQVLQSADGIQVGATVENFSLPDLSGETKSLNDLKGSSWLREALGPEAGDRGMLGQIAGHRMPAGAFRRRPRALSTAIVFP